MKSDLLFIDSFAWLEILKGSKTGKTALEQMKNKKLLTSVANLYEVFYRVAQAISQSLPNESREKKLLDGFLSGKERIKEAVRKGGGQQRLG